MGFYRDRVVPRIVHAALGGEEWGRLRARAAEGLAGEVLEVGFGSGLNLPHYPAAVTRVLAVEPAPGARKLAAARVADSPVPVEFVGLRGEELPLDDASVDHAFTTWTLCTIPDVGRALAEIRRVLRPGGALHFLEHGLAPDAQVARWQHRLEPLQRRLLGGCHLTRPIGELVAAGGLEVADLANFYVQGPKPMSYLYAGTGAKVD